MGRQITWGRQDSIKCWYYSDRADAKDEWPEGVEEYGQLRRRLKKKVNEAIHKKKDTGTAEGNAYYEGKADGLIQAMIEMDKTPPHKWFKTGPTNKQHD